MTPITRITAPEELDQLPADGEIAPLSREELAAHAPDLHLALTDGVGGLAARCSLWWRAVPPLPGERVGIAGHFAARDAAAAADIFAAACRELAANGCSLAVGPMDGTTWRRYRFITRRGDEPVFFLEPDNPDSYPLWFARAGFSPLARYFSHLDPDLGWRLPAGVAARLERSGITIRPLDPDAFAGELDRIYAISTASFSGNFLYSPIARDEFAAMYDKVRAVIEPYLVLFAEHEGTPVGFIFAIGDLLRSRAGQPRDTVILKSIAVLPEWNGRGIGGLLMDRATTNARLLGYRRAIHALIHEDNSSRSLSGRHAAVMREYALFARRLP